MNFWHLDWQNASGFCAVLVALCGGVFALLRQSFRGTFVTHNEHQELSGKLTRLDGRVAQVESRIEKLPTSSDIAAMGGEIAQLKTGVAVLGSEQKGTREIVGRIERMTNMILEDRLQGEQK